MLSRIAAAPTGAQDLDAGVTALTVTAEGAAPIAPTGTLTVSGLAGSGTLTLTPSTGKPVTRDVASASESFVLEGLPILAPGETYTLDLESDNGSDTAVTLTGALYAETNEAAAELTDSVYKPNRFAAVARVTTGSIGEDVDFELSNSGGVLETKTVTVVDNYNGGKTSTTIATQAYFDVALSQDADDLTLSVTPSSGSSATVEASQLFTPDERFGAVPTYGDAMHCFATACLWRGKLVEIIAEAGGARRHLSVDGQPWGELFGDVPASDREPEDKYHTGSAVAARGDLLACAMTDHQQRLYVTWGRSQADLLTRGSLAVSDASDTTTYAAIAVGSDGSLWVLTRVIAATKHELHLYQITGTEATSPTVRKIVLTSTTTLRCYPRHLSVGTKDDGGDLVLIGSQNRIVADGQWSNSHAYAFDPADSKVYCIDGRTNDDTTDGTPAAPKITPTELTNSTFGTADSPTIIGGGSYHRYCLPFAMRVDSWGGTKRIDVAYLFADTSEASLNDADNDQDTRLVYAGGSARYVTTASADVLGVNGSPSYRHTAVTRWAARQQLEIWIGSLTSFSVTDDYNQFGAQGSFTRHTVAVGGVADGADLTSRVTERAETLPIASSFGAQLRSVRGSEGIIVCEAGTHVDETRGTASRSYYGLPETAISSRLTTARAAKLDTLPASGTVPNTTEVATPSNVSDVESAVNTVSGNLTTQTGLVNSIVSVLPADSRDIAGAGDTAANLDQVSSGGSGTVTVEDPGEDMTWTFPRSGSPTLAAQVVRCKVGSAFSAQFDLNGLIEKDAALSGTPTATSTGPTAGTVVNHASLRKCNVPLSDIDTAGTYTVSITFTTTTSQTLVVSGTLEVSA